MKLKRILALILTLATVFCTVVACAREPQETDTTESIVTENASAKLLVANLSKYSIIVPQSGISDELAAVISELKMLLEEKATRRLDTVRTLL